MTSNNNNSNIQITNSRLIQDFNAATNRFLHENNQWYNTLGQTHSRNFALNPPTSEEIPSLVRDIFNTDTIKDYGCKISIEINEKTKERDMQKIINVLTYIAQNPSYEVKLVFNNTVSTYALFR